MRTGLNTSRSHMWGFDSFQGMPDSDATDRAHHQHVSSWRSGGLNAAEQLKLTRWSELRAAILGNIAHGVAGRVHLMRGFFNESLAPGLRLARARGMRPARLIDFDCDLASSTRQALSFMIKAQLLVPGSYVYYDDASKAQWASRNATEQTLAHRQMSAAYGLQWEMLRCRWPKSWQWRAVLRLTACERCPVSST